uniref:Uncharacterized protein n=1 Tax=uncultured marine group II/III euryarchaeote AD1000_69_E07 TaxID=1457801 RepID=A0A075FWU9_9EURY|nr:hypothetical protein [uncultured marine group II/III euryarchaeote AD1000_69_E07]
MWAITMSTPASAYWLHVSAALVIIRWQSMVTSGPRRSRTERIRAGPKVMVRLITQLPSITSMWIHLMPAATASSRVSPSLEKSAVRMLGVISTGRRERPWVLNPSVRQ